MKLDRVDNQILAALQRDGRISNRELAELVHLSESACLRRVRALEEAGVIDRYAALVNQSRVGLPGNAGDLVRLRNYIEGYEFDEARELVTRLLERFGSRAL